MDLALEGAGIEFAPPDQGPVLPVGSAARMRFQLGDRAVEVGVQIRYRRETDRRRYGVRFTGVDSLGAASLAQLRTLVNQRAAFRVSPAESERILVRIAGPSGRAGYGAKWSAPLIDLSASGMAVKVGRRVEEELCHTDRVAVELQLPRQATLKRVEAFVRNRVLLPDGVRYGLHYDETDAGFPGVQSAIMGYVMKCQRDAIQRGG